MICLFLAVINGLNIPVRIAVQNRNGTKEPGVRLRVLALGEAAQRTGELNLTFG